MAYKNRDSSLGKGETSLYSMCDKNKKCDFYLIIGRDIV